MMVFCCKWPVLGGGCAPRKDYLQHFIKPFEAPALYDKKWNVIYLSFDIMLRLTKKWLLISTVTWNDSTLREKYCSQISVLRSGNNHMIWCSRPDRPWQTRASRRISSRQAIRNEDKQICNHFQNLRQVILSPSRMQLWFTKTTKFYLFTHL